MDAYDIIFKMMDLWREHADKTSGVLLKNKAPIEIIVNTNDGYRSIVGMKWNSELRKIELILDEE